MKVAFALVITFGAVLPTTAVAQQSWEFRGEFVAIKAGEPELVVLRLSDGRTIEVPLESLSETGQAAARKLAADLNPPAAEDGSEGDVVTVRGPFGRLVRVTVPESIKGVEADAIHCRTAAAAVDVYRLFLAGGGPTPEQRSAAEARQREWATMAEKGLVRLGDRWVPPDEARAAADEAEKVVDHALELMRLGNADLAEEELRKAGRIDPENGRPAFVMGLAYALVARNPAKAAEQFADALRRSPNDPAALANVSILEVYTRRYGSLVDRFRDAMAAAVDPLLVAENIAWAVKLAGDANSNPALAKSRMPDKTVDDLNALYRTLTQDLKIKPPASVAAPRFLGPDGTPCTVVNLPDVAKRVEAAGASDFAIRRALGFVVAPGHCVCPRQAIVGTDGKLLADVAVQVPTERGSRLAATVVAAPEDGDVAILKCDGLSAEPVPLAAAMPPLPAIAAVDRPGDSWLAVVPAAARGKVVTPALQVQARGRFVHTAVVPRGPGGGPIVDDTGRAVGMVAATPRTDASGNAAGFGIPVERIMPLLKEHLPDVAAADAADARDPAAAERRAIAATVIVSARTVKPAMGAVPPGAP